jgi:hypothetical protein
MSEGIAGTWAAEERCGIRLQPGQTALVGYGSLLSTPSLERTLGRTYDGPFLPCLVRGWRRTWDAAMPNRRFYADGSGPSFTPEHILYLNVRPDPDCSLNCVIFVVNKAELAAYDERESIYYRVDITHDLDIDVQGGRAYIYVCRPEHCLSEVESPERAAVRATYLRIVEDGLSAFSDEFRRHYVESTDPVPEHLVIQDRS